jgi:DNA polymerase-3 subunit chi
MNIDFYILETATAQQALLFTCKLVEKHPDEPIYLHTSSQQEAERLDALLWTYKDDSFIPHALYDPAATHPPRVQIGHTSPTTGHLLINLTQEIPAFYQQFPRMIEIVFSDPHVQQLARERFRQYREQGCELNTYKMKTHDDN